MAKPAGSKDELITAKGDSATVTDGFPPLTPQSRRIQAAASRFGVARILGAARNPLPAFESIETVHTPIAVLKQEHLISRVAATTRDMDRPGAVEDWMTTCTAQFILRNTHRATRDDVSPDALQFDRVPGRTPESVTAAVADAMRASRRLQTDTASERLTSYVAQRAQLMVEPWPDHFGRPDPVDVQES